MRSNAMPCTYMRYLERLQNKSEPAVLRNILGQRANCLSLPDLRSCAACASTQFQRASAAGCYNYLKLFSREYYEDKFSNFRFYVYSTFNIMCTRENRKKNLRG